MTKTTFKSLNKPPVRMADQVYEQLLDAIQHGAITVENRLVQEKLAEEFGISRTPVREALFRLEQESIIQVAKRGGFRLREIELDEITDIYIARAALEAEAARLVTRNKTDEQITKLRAVIKKEEAIKEDTVQAYYRANYNIHRAITTECGNRYIIEMVDSLWTRGFSRRLFATIKGLELTKSLGMHGQLIDAIATGDGDHAHKVMYDHVLEGLDLQLGTE